jgi:hypothetical protein
MANLGERMFRAAKLDVNLYEEVEADKEALGQATAVVVLSSLAAGLGMGMRIGIGGIVIETLVALVVWYIWALLTCWIGTKILPEPQTESDVGELLRTLGFASAPGLIRILGVIPGLRGIVFLISSIWMLIAMVIAVRQALDYRSTGRAIGVCAIGWVVQLVVFGILMGLLGGFSRGV